MALPVLFGRRIKTVLDGYQGAGNHEVTWDAGDFASGIYICRLETPLESISRKMVLTK